MRKVSVRHMPFTTSTCLVRIFHSQQNMANMSAFDMTEEMASRERMLWGFFLVCCFKKDFENLGTIGGGGGPREELSRAQGPNLKMGKMVEGLSA